MLEETNKLWKLADRRTGMNILICDDERFAAEKIAEMVSRLENVKTLLRKYNGEYAMEYDEGWFTFTGEIDNYPIL